jgi:hypothetical protein
VADATGDGLGEGDVAATSDGLATGLFVAPDEHAASDTSAINPTASLMARSIPLILEPPRDASPRGSVSPVARRGPRRPL